MARLIDILIDWFFLLVLAPIILLDYLFDGFGDSSTQRQAMKKEDTH